MKRVDRAGGASKGGASKGGASKSDLCGVSDSSHSAPEYDSNPLRRHLGLLPVASPFVM